jgi:hypothetical protein
MRQAVVWSLLVVMLVSAGCATDKRTYYWASSKGTFYPVEAKLERIIERSDASGRKTPPGILAEYGYVYFERGEMESAVYYFEREAREWPESAEFMKKMIERAKAGGDS